MQHTLKAMATVSQVKRILPFTSVDGKDCKKNIQNLARLISEDADYPTPSNPEIFMQFYK